VFFGWQTGEMQVTVDGESRSGRMIDAMICNGRYLGGGMMMCPEAEPDDGLFDVLLIGDVTKRDLAFVLPKTYKGKHLPHPRLELLRGSSVVVESHEPLPIELDGEQPGTTPVRFEVVPRALRLRVPATG
jgi:diacylglycerol kinase (ATP)